MSDYTPTDAEVREDLWHAYWSHNSYERMIRGDHTPVTRAEFDHLIAKVRAEALREAYADLQAYTDSGAPFGHRPVEEFLLHRADRIEREAGL